MGTKFKVLTVFFLLFFISLIFYWQQDQDEVFKARSTIKEESQTPKPKNEKKVESHARQYEDDFIDDGSEFGDDIREVDQEEESAEMSMQDYEALEKMFDEVEEKWEASMENLIKQDLGLSNQVLEDYYELREDYDQAKLNAYEDYHQQMVKKHGEDYAFNPSVQLENVDTQVLPEYLNQLEALIGGEGIRKYTAMKDRFNEEIREKGHAGMALILIDF